MTRRVMCAYCREFWDRDSELILRLAQVADRRRVGWVCRPCKKRMQLPTIPTPQPDEAMDDDDPGEAWKRGKEGA